MLWWVYIWMQLQLIRTGVTDCPYRVNSVVHSSSEKFQKLKRCRDCALSIRETSYLNVVQFTWVQFSGSVESDSLRRHESKHARPPCPSPTPGIHPNSCPWSRWCHPAISSSVVPFSSCPQSLPASVFSNDSPLHMRWPNYWNFSFSISPSKIRPQIGKGIYEVKFAYDTF